MCFGLPALIKKSIGLKKIPPPIPTIPEINPRAPPIKIETGIGIFGQLTKNAVINEIPNYWYLLVAVLIGGQLGNFLNLKIFPTRILALVTAILVIFVALRMGFKIF